MTTWRHIYTGLPAGSTFNSRLLGLYGRTIQLSVLEEPAAPVTYHWALNERQSPRPGAIDLGDLPIRQDMVVVYGQSFGLYPTISGDGWKHGGLPQLADLEGHAARLTRDIDRAIPDRDWDGYAVINYEHWYPSFDVPGPTGVYREASIKMVMERHPDLSREQATEIARGEYECAAREFIIATLRHCREQRPNAKWGIWGLPRMAHHAQVDQATAYPWLWPEVDAIYQSSYVREPGTDYPAQMTAAMELAHIVSMGKPIVLFVTPTYRSGDFLDDADLNTAIHLPGKLGAAGVAIWEAVKSERDIEEMQAFIGDRLGPALQVKGN